jgi:serine/threonine-protein kinase
LGDEVALREDRTGTKSAVAWSLVQQSGQARKAAQRLASHDSAPAADARYLLADSLLAAAEDADPSWATPIVRRAQLAAAQVRTRSDLLRSAAFITDAIAHAERALALDPRNAEALEVRGSLRYTKRRLGFAPDPTESAELLRLAEQDLRQATTLDPSRAGAWNALSVILYEKYNRVEANLAARRAFEEDAYLSAAPDVIWRLFATSYDLEQFVDATQWCELGGKRYPAQARFSVCRLMLMGTKLRRPDVAEAWRMVNAVAEHAPPPERERARREAEIMAAVVIARAQLVDSARRVLLRARAGRDIDPRGDLLGAEAVTRAMINDKDEAIRLLQTYLTSHPEHREGFVKANTWWWRSLQDDPRFRALVGVDP